MKKLLTWMGGGLVGWGLIFLLAAVLTVSVPLLKLAVLMVIVGMFGVVAGVRAPKEPL